MTLDQITEKLTPYLLEALSRTDLEQPKLDFKREWYDLKSTDGIMEFLKDTSSMANTVGPDAFIIIGLDDKNGELYNSPFKYSNLNDSNELMNIISKHITPIYTLNFYSIRFKNTELSILHIPPSLIKPHFLKCYKKNGREEQNRIFVRKGTGTQFCASHDLELMLWDRKNITPEYSLEASIHKNDISIVSDGIRSTHTPERIKFSSSIENLGKRPVSIIRIKFELCTWDNPEPNQIFKVDYFLDQPLLIQTGKMQNHEFTIYFDKQEDISKLFELKVRKTSLKILSLDFQISTGIWITPILHFK